MRLISMVDFVITQWSIDLNKTQRERINNYANFLKQPLKLEMFVPCDNDGNVFEEPEYHEPHSEDEIGQHDELQYQYQQAKQNVFFEDWRFDSEADDFIYLKHKDLMLIIDKWNSSFEMISENCYAIENIEDLIQFDLTLTQTAIKKLGL